MTYFIKTDTIINNKPAEILKAIGYDDATLQTTVVTKLIGKTVVNCYTDIYDGNSEDRRYAAFKDDDYVDITQAEYDKHICTNHEETED